MRNLGGLSAKFLLLLAVLFWGALSEVVDAAGGQSYKRFIPERFNCDPVRGFNSEYPPLISLAGSIHTYDANLAFVCERTQADGQVSYQLVVDASPKKDRGWQTWHPFGSCPDVIILEDKPGGLRLEKHTISNKSRWWTKLADNNVTLPDSVSPQCMPDYDIPVLLLEVGGMLIRYTCINGDWYT